MLHCTQSVAMARNFQTIPISPQEAEILMAGPLSADSSARPASPGAPGAPGVSGASGASGAIRTRKVYRNINIGDLAHYRLPIPGIISILHRISGALLFLSIPLLLGVLQASVNPDVAVFRGLYGHPLVKLILFVLLWSVLHHLCAGIRYLIMDVNHGATELKAGRQSAAIVMVVSVALTLIVGVKLW